MFVGIKEFRYLADAGRYQDELYDGGLEPELYQRDNSYIIKCEFKDPEYQKLFDIVEEANSTNPNAYQNSPAFKEAQRRYNKSYKGKESQRRYSSSDKGKEARDRYAKSNKGKEARQRYLERQKQIRDFLKAREQ